MDEKRLAYWRTQTNAVVIIRLDMDPPEFRVGELLSEMQELREALSDEHNLYLATNGGHEFSKEDCPTCALLARAGEVSCG